MKNLLLLFLFNVVVFKTAFSQDELRPFITTWNIPSEGSFNIPLSTSQIYDFEFFVIQESDTLFSGVHTSADGDFSFGSIEPDTVALHIYGAFPHFTGYSKSLLLDVNQWGDIVWESMFQTFNDWRGTGFSATDAPDLSQVINMGQMFFRASSFNDDISDWDVGNIMDMTVLFRGATAFNQDLSTWDLRNVTNTAFMFENADSFNQDLSTWNVSNVNNMTRMFNGADSFNQDLGSWDVSRVGNMTDMLDNTNLSTANYDNTLAGWSALPNLRRGVDLDATGIEACEAEIERFSLINDFNWNITDGGTCNEATNILFFEIDNEQVGKTVIDLVNHTISLEVFSDTDLADLTPTIILSEGASSEPATGISQDFSSEATYTVTAEDGITIQEWTVSVSFTDQQPFTTSWSAIADENITIELNEGFDYNFTYIWKNANGDEIAAGRHTSADGAFVTSFIEQEAVSLEIIGAFPHFQNYPKVQLLDVNQWGEIEWGSMASSFQDWPGEGFSATDAPNLNNVANMTEAFRNAVNFNGNINDWDVSNVTDMESMFDNANAFNQDLNEWNVSNVRDMSFMFRNTSDFNGNISTWNVENVNTMFRMFQNAAAFNQDLTNWKTLSLKTMQRMFDNAGSFNGDITSWNVESVTNMAQIFVNARSFNQSLGNWNISNVTNLNAIFNGSGLSPQNYDETLIRWAASPALQQGVRLGANDITFCKAEAARAILTDPEGLNWQIEDDGQFCLDETVITFFDSNLENGLGIIKGVEGVISLAVSEGTDVSAIVPTINLSSGATISPAPGTPVDLNNVVYTVTAEDGITTQDYAVEVTGPRFITTWVVEGDEGITFEGSEEGFDYDFEYIIVGANNTDVSIGSASSFDGIFPLEAGEYRIEITGEFPHFAGYPVDQLLDVLQWGDIEWKSMKFSFQGWEGTTFSATDAPDLSSVTDITGMFENAFNFNGNLSNWDVSAIEDMNFMFYNAIEFNGNLSEWNVSSVTNMQEMFATDTGEPMAFNSNISSWDVGKVANMAFMFNEASLFNRDLSSWDVSSLEAGAGTGADGIFNGAGLSPQNYDKTLIGWAAQEVKDNVTLGADGITFCKGSEARQSLIDDHNWIIDDAGSFCSSETDILSFTIEGQFGGTSIDEVNHTISLSMPFATDLSALVPDFELSVGALASPASSEIVDFSGSVIYTITAEDGITTQNWEVSVTEAPNTATDIETVFVNTENEDITIDAANHTVNIRFAFGTDITAVPVAFAYSEGAISTVGESGTFDLKNPLVITVTAQDGITTQEWTITAAFAPNTATDIETAFVNAENEEVTIDAANHEVNIRFTFGTDITAIPIEFSYSEGATSNIGESGTFDLTNPLVITITAQDGITTQEWIISAEIALNTATDILAAIVNVENEVIFIDDENHTVNIFFAFGTDITAVPMEFSYSEGATSSAAESGTFDLTNPLAITVTAQDGITSQEWTVSAEIAPNTATDIETAIVNVENEEITIDAENHTINIHFGFGTDVTAVPVEFAFSEGATSTVGESGTFDLTNPLAITVTAQDGITTQEWTVSAEIAPNTATDIETAIVNVENEEITIDAENHTINIRFGFGTDVTAVPVEFAYSEGATSTVGESGTFDLTNPLAITVTAQDGITSQEWTVSAEIAPNTATDIETAIVNVENEEITIDAENHTVNIRFGFGTDVTAVPVEFAYSEGATSTVGESGTFDLTNPLAITVTAQDGITTQEWTVSAEIAPNTATDIETAIVNVENEEITIDAENHTVNIRFGFGTDVTAVPVEFAYSEGATSTVGESGTFDLTNPLAITVTAQDGITTQEWTVSAEIAPNTATDIETAIVNVENEEITIDAENHTVNIRFGFGTDVTAVPVEFAYSEGATSTVGESGTFDLTNPLAITVTAQDGETTREWIIAAEVAPNTATNIVGVTINSETEEIVIDTENRTVIVLFTDDSDLSAVAMNFSYSEGANSNFGDGGVFDLTLPLTITVTAQDGITAQQWILIAFKEEKVLGINEKLQEVKYYPNPVLDILYVESSIASTTYLMDLNGRRVTNQKKGSQIWLDVSHLKPGVYFLLVELNQNKTLQRIIKR